MIYQNDKSRVNLSQNKYVFYVLILAIIGFVAITTFVVVQPSNFIDIQFTLKIQECTSNFLDAFMTAISLFGHIQISAVMVVAVAIVFLLFKYKKEALFIVLTLVAGVVSTLIKYFVNRPRPSRNLVRVIEVTHQQSFPSGHVLFYTVFFGFIIYLMFRLKEINFYLKLISGGTATLMVILIFYSRIYLGAHWLTDIMAGYLLGIICLYVLIYFYELKHYKI